MERNAEIDTLRGIITILVVAGHLWLFLFTENSADSFGHGFGTTCIDLSLAISGFVISSILVNRTDQLKGDKANLTLFLKAYAISRFFRIYPAMWTAYFLVLLLSFSFISIKGFSTPTHVFNNSFYLITSTYNYFFISRNFTFSLLPLWSLMIEGQFYLSFPLFLLLTKNNQQRIKIFIGMILLVTFVVRPITVNYYGLKGIYFTQSRCDAIFYGCLIYLLSQQRWFVYLKPQIKMSLLPRMMIAGLLLYLLIGVTTIGLPPAIYLTLGNLIGSTLLISAVFNCSILTFPKLIQEGLDFIAPRSYSLYIIHSPMIFVADGLYNRYSLNLLEHSAWPKVAFAVCLILVSNEILYQFVLNPAMRKGTMISRGLTEKIGSQTLIANPSK